MDKALDFLKKVGTYYLATIDGDQARVRPFGTIHKFEDKLYFQTGTVKDVYKQLLANPKIEICAFDGEAWIRVAATAVEDPRIEAGASLLDAYPTLQARYKAGDGNSQVFYLQDATATFASFTSEPEVVTF